jgi:hypothetical protein
MTAVRGTTNLQLGHPAWASAQYDHATRDYVIELDGDDADRFRKVADLYGYRESDSEPVEPDVVEQPQPDPVDGEVTAPEPIQSDGHERDYPDLAHAIDNARDDDELDESDDDVDDVDESESDESDENAEPEPEPEPEPKPAPKARRTSRRRNA